MGIYENLETFRGKPVVDFAAGRAIASDKVYRLGTGYNEAPWDELWEAFLAQPGVAEIEELVIGLWDYDSGENNEGLVATLVAAKDKLPKLKALFVGDITGDQCEISWIKQSDLSPLLAAFPHLEHLQIRGGDGLELRDPRHDRLRTLIIETGGLGANVVQSLGKARFPQLEHLELWLGDKYYGGNVTPADLAPILGGELFPNLTYLGLCNSDIADDLAAAVADAPILEKLEVLDLSKGNLSNVGCEALMQFPLAARLEKLDMRHHYVSPECVARLEKAGIKVDASESAGEYIEGDEDRYIHVSE